MLLFADRYGELNIGTTTDLIENILRNRLIYPVYILGCSYARMLHGPCGLSIMFQKGRITRFDVDARGVMTDQGKNH